MVLRMLIALMLAAIPSLAAALPPVVYVVRHLHTPADAGDDPDLTDQGRAAAKALTAWLAGRPVTAVYLVDVKRSRETAAPTLAAYRLTAKTYAMPDTAALIGRVKAETGPVLIVGHTTNIPDIVEALGGTRPAPIALTRFGDLWTVTPPSGVTATTLPGTR